MQKKTVPKRNPVFPTVTEIFEDRKIVIDQIKNPDVATLPRSIRRRKMIFTLVAALSNLEDWDRIFQFTLKLPRKQGLFLGTLLAVKRLHIHGNAHLSPDFIAFCEKFQKEIFNS